MTTPINGPRLGPQPGHTDTHPSRAGVRAEPGALKAPSDDVELSPAARELRTTENVVPFDAARVAALRDAIAKGTYHVDPERLAERFATLERDLTGGDGEY